MKLAEKLKYKVCPPKIHTCNGGATNEELVHTVSLCKTLIQQAEADGLIEKEK